MMTEDYVELENLYGAHNYEPLDVVLARGEGVWVWDVYGRRYLDCLAGYSALSQGQRLARWSAIPPLHHHARAHNRAAHRPPQLGAEAVG